MSLLLLCETQPCNIDADADGDNDDGDDIDVNDDLGEDDDDNYDDNDDDVMKRLTLCLRKTSCLQLKASG